MNERERIIDLMKKGILSTEEGLDLLEGLAKKEDDKQEYQEFASQDGEPKEVNDAPVDQPTEEAQDSKEQQEAEEELEQLVEEINRYSVNLDQLNKEIDTVKSTLSEKENELKTISDKGKEGFKEEKQVLLDRIKGIQKELEMIRQLDEVDTADEMDQLKEDIQELSSELDDIEQREEEFSDEETIGLQEEINELKERLDELNADKQEQIKNLNRTKMKQWTVKAKKATASFQIPQDWKKEVSDELANARKEIESASKGWSGSFKKGMKQVQESETTQSVRSSLESVLGHLDWKSINLKLPTLAAKEYKREWTFEKSTATILDIKLANGKLTIIPSDNETIKLSAKGKLYGKIEESSPDEFFESRSTVTVDEDKVTIHIPSKRISADLELALPKRTYDYVSIVMLNGKLVTNELYAKDVFAKSTNGSLTFEGLHATMLEAKGSNGGIDIVDSELKDLLAGSVNGSISFKGSVESADVSTTNGEIKLTFMNENLIRVGATTVNGNVKMAIPESVALEGKVKTSFGKVKSRLNNTEPNEKHEQTTLIKRINGQTPLDFKASTTTGNILLKDTDN